MKSRLDSIRRPVRALVEGPLRALLRSFSRLPIRTRLLLAFVILIISSASATIAIGDAVFGNSAAELARDTVTLYGSIASRVLDRRLESLRLMVQGIGDISGAGDGPRKFDASSSARGVDFLLLKEGADSAGYATVSATTVASQEADRIVRSLSFFLRRVSAGRTAEAGFCGSPIDQGLLLVAAAPLKSGGGWVLAGCRVNGRQEFIKEAQDFLPDRWRERMTLTVFGAGGNVVLDDGQTGLREPDERITDAVLRRGGSYAGLVREGGASLYAAYVPLRDVSGTVVGMVGTGDRQDAATALRKRTTALFTSLIVAGMVFGFIMSVLFSAWLVSPIGRLAEGVARVAGGDLEHKVRVESADELGKLTRAFNRMVQAIRERDHKLREMTESRLTQAEKQISIGRLAAGVAHEINNPLTAMLTLSMLWLKKLPPDDPRRGDVEIIVAEATRCREIVQNLLDFARERPVETQLVDINSVIQSTLILARNYAAVANVQLCPSTAAVPLVVNADAKLLRQVFINLLINSAEAVGQGGIVSVETDEDSSGGFVQVRIVDNGKGIPREHLERVFEPFFTTKPAGKGTGLGLSVSLGIVQKHGGTIEIQSEAGKGTTVIVLLPRVKEAES